MPISDPSLPMPDSLIPPNGTTQLDMKLSLTPTCKTINGGTRNKRSLAAPVFTGGSRAHAVNAVSGTKTPKNSQPRRRDVRETYHANLQLAREPQPLGVVLRVDVSC